MQNWAKMRKELLLTEGIETKKKVFNLHHEVKCKIKEDVSPCALVLLLSAKDYVAEKCCPLQKVSSPRRGWEDRNRVHISAQLLPCSSHRGCGSLCGVSVQPSHHLTPSSTHDPPCLSWHWSPTHSCWIAAMLIDSEGLWDLEYLQGSMQLTVTKIRCLSTAFQAHYIFWWLPWSQCFSPPKDPMLYTDLLSVCSWHRAWSPCGFVRKKYTLGNTSLSKILHLGWAIQTPTQPLKRFEITVCRHQMSLITLSKAPLPEIRAFPQR